MVAWPESGFKMVARMRTAVVLPAPLGPSSPRIVPCSTCERHPVQRAHVALREDLDEIVRLHGIGGITAHFERNLVIKLFTCQGNGPAPISSHSSARRSSGTSGRPASSTSGWPRSSSLAARTCAAWTLLGRRGLDDGGPALRRERVEHRRGDLPARSARSGRHGASAGGTPMTAAGCGWRWCRRPTGGCSTRSSPSSRR